MLLDLVRMDNRSPPHPRPPRNITYADPHSRQNSSQEEGNFENVEVFLLICVQNKFLFHVMKTGESNGILPLRTCRGCSVPEPYRSPDWALVPAQTGPRVEY